MKSKWFRLCCLLLVLVMTVNSLPLMALAEEYQVSNTEKAAEEQSVLPSADDSTPHIVAEKIDKRTKFSKEFLLSNGVNLAVLYNSAVHYEESGHWEEIDNTLQINTDGTLTNTAGIWDVAFPLQLDNTNRICITKDGYTLSFGMAGELRQQSDLEVMSADAKASLSGAADTAKVSLDGTLHTFTVRSAKGSSRKLQTIDHSKALSEAEYKETVLIRNASRLCYGEIYANTDVQYDLQGSTVKESVIIGSYDQKLRGYRYTIDAGGLVPVVNSDNSIYFYDKSRKNVVMTMPAPFLVDDNGSMSEDVRVSLTQSGSEYTLCYLLPQAWLASKDRAWPVVLDPIINADTNINNIRDRSIHSKSTTDQDWGKGQMGYSVDYGISRFLLKYDNLPTLSSADVIVNATIELTTVANSYTIPIEVHKVNETWKSETVSWSNKPSHSEKVEDYVLANTSKTRSSWDITDIARGWYEGENTGMIFTLPASIEDAQETLYKQVYSSDYSDYIVPTLYIVFRNNNGLEGYWDYTSSSAGRAGTGHVNQYTGNLVWVHDDIGFGGNRMPVSISHIYNANDKSLNTFGMGYGWRTNFNQRVYEWTQNSNFYIWEDADGTKHYFYQSGSVYKDEDGMELTLTTTGSGTTKYCIADKNGNKSYFDTKGRLSKQENNQKIASSITVSYTTTTGKLISTITDGAGRKYNFSYSDSLLSKITYVGTGTTEVSSISYGYTDSELTSVTYKDGEKTTFTYSSNHLLTDAADIDGYKLKFAYTTETAGKPNRIKKVSEYDGDTLGGVLNYEYAHNQTTLTDHNGNMQILQFNDFGNTVSAQDGEGHAQYAEYARTKSSDETGKGNQLKATSKLQNTVVNLLQDTSFEGDTLWTATSGTASIETGGYLGSKSLKVTGGRANSATFSIAKGESCTFSAHVKTSGTGGYLLLYDGDTQVAKAAIPDTNTWTRVQVSYTNTSSSAKTMRASVYCKEGETVYTDCVQVEKSPTASRYNLIQNGDFNFSTNWTSSGFTDGDGRLTMDDSAFPQLSTKGMKLTGSPTVVKKVKQSIPISGVKGDAYIIAGWALADSVPLRTDNENREFGIRLTFNNTDDTKTKVVAQFNCDTNATANWQYSAAAAVAEKAYSSLTVEVLYAYNANTAYFDGIQLYKEEFSQSYAYDEKGRLISVTDLQKQTTTYEYDEETNDLLTENLPTDAKMTYDYDDYHNVIKATTATGVVYEFVYDEYGNNTSVSITSGTKTLTSTASYENKGNTLAKTVDAAGKPTTYEYNADTNVLEWVKYPNDSTATRTNYTYDSMYRMASAAATTNTDLALSAAYSYTDDLLTKIKTGSTTYTFAYGDFGLRNSVKIGSRTLASYTYTSQNNYLDTLAYGNGDSVKYEYDTQGRVTKQTYEDGDTVTYRYDNDGALATVTDSASGISTTYYYDFIDRMMKYVESGDDYSHSVGYEYDTINNLTKIIEDIGGNQYKTAYSYDDDNRVTQVAQGNTKQTYGYDGFGRLDESILRHGDTTVVKNTYGYREPTTTTTTGQIASHTVDAANYDKSYTYTYDSNSNLKTVTVDGKTTTYFYDTGKQLIRENNEAAGKTWVYSYDNAGNILTKKEYAYTTGTLGTVQDTVTYTYGDSSWGDLLTEYDGKKITVDTIGNPKKVGNERSYTWVHGREMESVTTGVKLAIVAHPEDFTGVSGAAVSFSVDARGEGLSYQWQVSTNGGSTWADSGATGNKTDTISDFTVTAARDGNMYRCVVTDSQGDTVTSEAAEICKVPIAIVTQPEDFYGAEGAEVSFSLEAAGTGLSYRWQVSANNGSTWSDSSATGYNTDTISNFTVSEARDGRLYRCIVTDSAGNSVTSRGAKLNMAALAITLQPEDFKGILGDEVSFSLTAKGSGLSYQWQVSTDGGSTWANSGASGNKTKSISNFDITDIRLGYRYRCIITDSAGNSVTSDVVKIQLVKETWTNSYNADGLRTKRTNGHTTYSYTYNGDKLSQMTVDGQTLRFGYSANGTPLYVQWNSSRYFYVTNQQGDVTAIISVNGIPVVEYTYDAWGNILSITGERATNLGRYNPLRYRGYVYDNESSLYYLQSRYYDPQVGRFLSADAFATTGQGLLGSNMFAYCLNAPVGCLDSSGTRCVSTASRLNDVGISNHAQQRNNDKRDVTAEIVDALNKATNRARSAQKVANLLFGDSLASDGFIYLEFYQLVNHKAPWDIKRPEPWELTIGTPYPGKDVYVVFGGTAMTPEHLGNFAYGYLGYAYGIPKEHLIAGSYYAAHFPTNSKPLANEVFDWVFISIGYEQAERIFGGY